jgi:hypothetical protein
MIHGAERDLGIFHRERQAMAQSSTKHLQETLDFPGFACIEGQFGDVAFIFGSSTR